MSGVRGPLKWHGGKHYLARRIVELMPPHVHYVEPFAGGLSVLLTKDPEGVSEVVNDVNRDLMNFWSVMQHTNMFPEFVRVCQATPFAEGMFNRAMDGLRDYTSTVGQAWAFFVLCRLSLAGRMKAFATLSQTRTRRGMNEQASAWINAVDGLSEVHQRLRRVVILNRNALDVIRQQDSPQTLFYLDPPYLHETRATTGEYAHEMTETEHERLLIVLRGIEGKFLLSGYRSELYDDCAAANNWHRFNFDLPNHAAGGSEKRRMTESVWTNF